MEREESMEREEESVEGVRRTSRPFRRLTPKEIAVIAALGLLLFLALHVLQLNWFERRCSVGVPLPSRPRSCDAHTVRVWIVPLLAGSGLFLVVGFTRMAGSWREARATVVPSLRHFLSWSPADLQVGPDAAPHRRWVTSACCAFGALLVAAVFLARNGTAVLDVRNTGWLSSGDPAQAYLGSVLYRAEPWGFPLGRLDGVMAPVGSNVGFTDPVMLVAVLAKAARAVFPPEGQYFGAWMLFCYLAFGVGCGLVVSRLTLPFASRLAATGLLALFPPLFFREGHFTLSAMFLIPFATHALQREARSPGGAAPFATQCLLLLLTAWLHPYLTVLVGVFVLAHAWYVARRRKLDFRALSALGLGSGILVVLSWWVIGYVGSGIPPGEPERPAFWTANLNALFNSMGKSEFLRALPLATGGQYEGFGYLGLGVLHGLVILLARHGGAVFADAWSKHRTLCLALLLGLVLSQGCLLSFGTLKVELPLWGYGEALSPFRSVGRFVWIPAFLVPVLAIAYVSAREGAKRSATVSVLLCGLLGIQWLDLAPFRKARATENPVFRPSGLASGAEGDDQLRAWKDVLAGKGSIVALPPFATSVAMKDDFALFWWLAFRHGATTNVGYVSRFDEGAKEPETRRIKELLAGGALDPSIVFVAGAGNEAAVAAGLTTHPGLECRTIGGYVACSGVVAR